MKCQTCYVENPDGYDVCTNCLERRVIDISQAEPEILHTLPHTELPSRASRSEALRERPEPGRTRSSSPEPSGEASAEPTGAVSVSDNEAYRGARLSFRREVDAKLSGEVAPSLLLRFFVRGVVAGLVALVGVGVLSFVLYLVGARSVAYALVELVPQLVFVGSFFMPYREGLSEWELLLDGKASAAESAYASIFATLTERKLPVTTSLRRFTTGVDPTVNNFVVVRDGASVMYVSVFAYGTGLYLGWTLWNQRSPFRMMLRYLLDLFGGGLGRQPDFAGALSSQRSRALRESVHSALRDCIDAVGADLQITMRSTFSKDIPVETVNLSATAGLLRPVPSPRAAAGLAGSRANR